MYPLRLNLLSPQKRKHMNRMVVFIFIKNVLEMFLFVVTIAGILFVGGRWFLQEYYNEVAAQLVRISNERGGVNQRIKYVNDVIAQTTQIQKGYVLWTPVLSALQEATPSGILLDSMVLDATANSYTFTGVAETRDDLLVFETALKSVDGVERVDLPLSQLTEKEHIPFIITAHLK